MSERSEQETTSYQVYATGYPDEGVAMTEEKLGEEIRAGNINARDLVWYQGVWRECGAVFDMPPYPEMQYGNDALPEIALDFSELPPFREINLLKKKSEKRKSPVFICFMAVILVGILIVAWMFWGASMVQNIGWHPANILVFNPFKSPAKVEFQGQTKSVGAFGVVQFSDITGHFPSKEAVVLKTESESLTAHVDLKGDTAYIVNPGNLEGIAIVRQEGLEKEIMTAERNLTIYRELSEKHAPDELLAYATELRSLANRLIVASVTGDVIESSESVVEAHPWIFKELGLKRSSEDVQKRGEEDALPACFAAELEKDMHAVRIKATGNQWALRVKDGAVHYTKGSDGALKVSGAVFRIDLPTAKQVLDMRLKELSPSDEYIVFAGAIQYDRIDPVSGDANCYVTYKDNGDISFRLEFTKKDFVITRLGKSMKGRWKCVFDYSASKKQWDWCWSYTGDGTKAHLRFDVPRDKAQFKRPNYFE